jgi:hypothetical protein
MSVAQPRASTEYIDLVGSYMDEITEPEVLPGDVVVYRLGLAYANAGIIVEWPNYIIHAIARYGVIGADGKNYPPFRRCERKFFRLKDEFCEVRS